MITADTPVIQVTALRDAVLAAYAPLSQYLSGAGAEFLVPLNIEVEALAEVMYNLWHPTIPVESGPTE